LTTTYSVSESVRCVCISVARVSLNLRLLLDWNIMSTDDIKIIADHVPTTVEELTALGVLGENKVAEYGDRIIDAVCRFVASKNLQEFVDQRRPLKRPKTADSASSDSKPSAIVIEIDDDDEFDVPEIDFSAISIPGEVSSKSAGKSPYFY
jgi:hypothetical protein